MIRSTRKHRGWSMNACIQTLVRNAPENLVVIRAVNDCGYYIEAGKSSRSALRPSRKDCGFCSDGKLSSSSAVKTSPHKILIALRSKNTVGPMKRGLPRTQGATRGPADALMLLQPRVHIWARRATRLDEPLYRSPEAGPGVSRL